MEENKTIMKQFIDCLKNNPDHAFDFIANEYYKFSKDELKDICKELLYGIYHAENCGYISKEDGKIIYECVADELHDNYSEE
ncbi:MAG: hypothetical protein IKW51_08745 [Bacteroidales bacterium]|nr:hypothetical protein [Bacteroidales bacterium]